MAVDPSQAAILTKRFFNNEATTLSRPEDPKEYLIQSVTRLLQECPPALPWAHPFRGEVYRGFFIGPTSIAYLFYTLCIKHPGLTIQDKLPEEWCTAYLELGQEDAPAVFDTSCGITNEYLASNALKACLYQSEGHATKVLDALRDLDTNPTYCEWLKGRAGALWLLRLIREGLPQMAEAVNLVITSLIKAMLPQQPWIWNERQYLGTVHGEIGILAQIILSDSSYAPLLESKLLSLLNLQGPEGNWPVIESKEIGLIQFCHGAPGFIVSLLAIKSHFPNLHTQIDNAIARGRKLIWERGLLKKEPNICHGIIGNALALDTPHRDHFLSLATPDKVATGIKDGTFEKDWDPFALLWGEAGRAWVWMEVWGGGEMRVPLYTDA